MDHLSAVAQQFKTNLHELGGKLDSPEFAQAVNALRDLASKLTTADRTALAQEVAGTKGAPKDLFRKVPRPGKDSGAAQSVAGESKGKDSGHVRSPAGAQKGRGSR